MFVDRVVFDVIAGKGGNGVVAWRREKYIPKGGPSGGSGGKGGSVIIEADENVASLDSFRNQKHLRAENGDQGGSKDKRGRDGKDLVIKVPCGTLVRDAVTEEVIADLVTHKQQILICEGGRGGRGNTTFKTATHQAPNICTPGKPGMQLKIELELKLIAEVGLVGFPNAGKSTLIEALTNVSVKKAAYPFTTLSPNLGFIALEDYTRIFVADIPGIIEGAHRNRGLGFEFLRHIERTKMLIFVLDASGIDGRTPTDDYTVLQNELQKYDAALLERPYLIVLNKMDEEASAALATQFHETFPQLAPNVIEISAVLGENISLLIERIVSTLRAKNSGY